jgi:hypothetical protein
MALIKLKRPSDGFTITVDENSPIRTAYLQQGWVIDDGKQTTPTTTQPTNTTGWVDPATGRQTSIGVGEPKSEYDKRNQTTTPTPTPTPNTEISPDDKKWINDLYQKYFDRPASSTELTNWVKETPQALDQFLAKEQKTYGYVSKAAGVENKARYDAAIAMTDASDLPADIKQIWKTVVGRYPNATDFETSEIINTFNKIKAETIDPYFKELADLAVTDIRTSLGQMQTTRDMELEQERTVAGENIRQARSGLEKAGMTFSGKGVEELGAESAYARPDEATTAIPEQIPFAGMAGVFNEGKIQQANRLMSTSSAARYQAQQQLLGRQAENLLGTSAVQGLGINYQPAGVNLTGTLANQAEEKKALTLQSLISQWREKQNLATNK